MQSPEGPRRVYLSPSRACQSPSLFARGQAIYCRLEVGKKETHLKLSVPSPARLKAPCRPMHSSKRRCLRSLVACVLAITFGLTLTSSLVRADPSALTCSVEIYLYNPSGPATDVTATYSFYNNHLYDPDGLLIGTGDASGQILDASSQAIGYVVSNDPPIP
jgi:hypothetical protein